MSVFTSISAQNLAAWLQNYSVGTLLNFQGISAGITNTNYFVTTDIARYVLTIFEENTAEELPFFLNLMSHLAARGVACPHPIQNKQGQTLGELHGKPAALVSCLRGRDIAAPSMAQCAEVGRTLATMHLAGQGFAGRMHNTRGLEWRAKTAEKILPLLNNADKTLLNHALNFAASLDLTSLPHGIIHADLFRDNVLFEGDVLGGVIDFYYACHDVLLYDVAIAVNDWCVVQEGAEEGALDMPRVEALLAAYQSVRAFTAAEHSHWHDVLRIAALRFWLSRLHDQLFPHAGELTHAKDPEHFKKILQLRNAL